MVYINNAYNFNLSKLRPQSIMLKILSIILLSIVYALKVKLKIKIMFIKWNDHVKQ